MNKNKSLLIRHLTDNQKRYRSLPITEMNLKTGKDKNGKNYKYIQARSYMPIECELCGIALKEVRYLITTEDLSDDTPICQKCYETLLQYDYIFDLNEDKKKDKRRAK